MFSYEKKAIENAIMELKKLLGENLIVVLAFGSRVKGDFTGESDFDVLVVVRKRTTNIIDMINSIFAKEEGKTGIPFTIVIKELESFKKEVKYNTTFYRNIKREGIVLYGSA